MNEERGLHGPHQGRRLDGLFQHVACAQPDCLHGVVVGRISADKNDLGPLAGAHALKMLGEHEPVEFRHPEIGDHHAHPRAVRQHLQAIPTIAGGRAGKPGSRQRIDKLSRHKRIVVHDQDVERLGRGNLDVHQIHRLPCASIAIACNRRITLYRGLGDFQRTARRANRWKIPQIRARQLFHFEIVLG